MLAHLKIEKYLQNCQKRKKSKESRRMWLANILLLGELKAHAIPKLISLGVVASPAPNPVTNEFFSSFFVRFLIC